jgi:WD40 repeat protein
VDVETGKQVWSLTGHDDEVTFVTYAPNSNVIASGSKDKTIRLWNTRTGQLITTLVGHTDDVIALAFNANSELISLSKDKTTIFWDVRAARRFRRGRVV